MGGPIDPISRPEFVDAPSGRVVVLYLPHFPVDLGQIAALSARPEYGGERRAPFDTATFLSRANLVVAQVIEFRKIKFRPGCKSKILTAMSYQDRPLVPPAPIGFPGCDNDAGSGHQYLVSQPSGINPGVGLMPPCP